MSAFAGGLLHNTNQHIAFMRMMARGASHEIDGVYTNPAGLAFMDHDGWTLSLNIQSATQSRDALTTFALFPEADHTRLYKGKASAPVIPSLYGAYKKDRWTFSGFFGFTGGGGKCSFDNGLPVFDASIMAGIYAQTAQLAQAFASNPATAPIMADPRISSMLPLTSDKYDINSSMKGRQYIYGLQLGATYKILDWMSAYVGGRMNYFDGNYTGFVKVLPKPELASGVQQVAIAYPSLAPTLSTLVNQNGEMANIDLNCSQTGWGVTPIIGLDLVWKGFTLAAKYEFKTNLSIENDTKTAIAEPAAFELIARPIMMLTVAYSARNEMRAVMAPGPAMSGKAIGTMLAPEEVASFLIMSRPRIISKARMKSTTEPATANDGMSMPKSRSRASPTIKKPTKSNRAAMVACRGLMAEPLSRMETKMGMEPVMSMIANMTRKVLKISTMLMDCNI